MIRKVFLCSAVGALALGVACSKSTQNPTSPSSSTSGTATTADGFLLKAGVPGTIEPAGGAQVQSDPITFTASTTKGTYTDMALQYHFQVRSGSTVVAEATVGPVSGSTATWTAPHLAFNTTFTWRVQAVYQGQSAPWSPDATFKSIGKFNNGLEFFDPLLDGSTVGIQRGGTIIPGQGWQSDALNAGLDYTVQTCSNCKLEFDVRGFGAEEGAPFGLDVKWITMGDGASFPSFGAFRDHPWKMTVEQRADDDTGIKMIWRNGSAGEGDPGDHTFKAPSGIHWDSSRVQPYHFILDWNPGGFIIAIDGNVVVQDGFARPYAPPNHTISLGCWPRSETMIGAIWSNVRLTRR
jgi:hypothetical protein